MQTTPIVKGWKSLLFNLLRNDQSLFLLSFSSVKGNPASDSFAPSPSGGLGGFGQVPLCCPGREGEKPETKRGQCERGKEKERDMLEEKRTKERLRDTKTCRKRARTS